MIKLTSIGRALIASIFLLTSANANAEKSEISMPSVKNFSSPEPHRYRSGQPSGEDFSELAKQGIKHVIDLRPPQETPDTNEAAQVTYAGMAYYNIPISSSGDLTIENVRIIDNILANAGEEKVLVHCASSNRVGAIMALRAAWLQNVPQAEAIEKGKDWGLTRLQPAVEKKLNK